MNCAMNIVNAGKHLELRSEIEGDDDAMEALNYSCAIT